ncbi:Hpt domain-containing protein [Thalassospira mesophila]|uniref:Uncharacterized protein n=1 Tax=Thalassospira mesophila TaxID=1293891 RepID=A0A1Y2KUW1_9PROT|nr:Hpt domain-containing protein [Thalassospira mesophila]OSQ35410.1 hypothetical protein TMES_21420 [Thalassospira mesophila]
MTTDPERKPTLREKLLKLQQGYADKVPGRLEDIQGMWQCYLEDGSEDILDQVTSQIHKMAGTAATYGFADLGLRASQAEETLLDFKESNAPERNVDTANNVVKNLTTFKISHKVTM